MTKTMCKLPFNPKLFFNVPFPAFPFSNKKTSVWGVIAQLTKRGQPELEPGQVTTTFSTTNLTGYETFHAY